MIEQSEAAAARPLKGSRAWWTLGALLAGLVFGAIVQRTGDGLREPAIRLTGFVGELWLDALKMTVIPLVVALLVVGIARGAEAVRGGRIAARMVAMILIVCTASAIYSALFTPFLLDRFPLPAMAADALRAGLAALDPAAASAPVPLVSDFFRNIIPSNVFASAADGEVLPLVVFALIFAMAIGQLAEVPRKRLVQLFEAIADALLTIIGWVLWLAPIGILALAFTLGASAGGAAFAGLLHYILIVSAVGVGLLVAAYPIAIFAARLPAGRFVKAMLPAQAVAISTRSSLASLPAMLASARILGIRNQVADIALPVAVALFRSTGPAMNLAVVLYVAHWLGIDPGVGQVIAATAVAAVISYGSVSLPGEVSFITSITPIAMALGVPLAPLALLVAVEMVPDIFRTLGNVTMDVAATGVVDRQTGKAAAETD